MRRDMTMANDDFPMPVKVRMWAFMAANYVKDTEDRLYHADAITEFLWADFEVVSGGPDKDDIN